ncbi:hypothetical protein [Thermomonospora umbrina]|uniref:Uncharacterized protein n=1 Tax=Thermomonospora umbrina TaxID=111806 RepID=A0A3D9SYM9_9ACTN|nr:hypothetical protein [Thermomonospora umbrina]REE97674.1 hypothetical protein DFJ69_3148 [Thermomonospora umbrina]
MNLSRIPRLPLSRRARSRALVVTAASGTGLVALATPASALSVPIDSTLGILNGAVAGILGSLSDRNLKTDVVPVIWER